jgi:hypothetical protein
MKTLKLILFFFTVTAIAAGFYSCDSSSDTVAPILAPGITFTEPTSQSINVDHYYDVVFSFTCKYNLTSKKALSKVKIVATYTPGGTETLMDTVVPTANSNAWTIQYVYTVSPNAPYNQVINLAFSVTDADNKTSSKTYTLSVKPISDILENDVTMGAQSNVTYGSYFVSDSCKVYKSGLAKQSANQPRVDFVYLNDLFGGNGDCIAAPSDPIVSDQTVDLCGPFSIKNATELKQLPPMSDSAYNKIRTSAAISALFNAGSGTKVTVVKTLFDGGASSADATIIVFKTKAAIPQYGILKVKQITNASDQAKNTMILNVRISKK